MGVVVMESNPFLHTASTFDLTPLKGPGVIRASDGFGNWERIAKGMIKVGMAADLAVLSQDILEVPLQALPGTRSLLTLVDGEAVHADGPFAALKR